MKTNNYTRFLVPLPQWRWMCSLLVLLGLSMTVTRAQLAINYPLTVSSGTYSSISGTGTPLTGAVLLDTGGENITGLPPFTVNSVVYTNARVCSNGWVALYASTAPTSTASTGLSTTITNAGAVFAPMSADLAPSNAASVAFYYQVIGNEIIFEWVNYSRYSGSGSNDILNYQVRLNTSTSAVAFVYGTCTAGTNPTSSPQVGWKTGAGTTWATDINNLMIDITGSPNTCSWADAVTGNANSSGMYIRNTAPTVGPASGLTYTWTPQASPAPVRTFAAPASITASGATVSWTAPSGAAQYNVQYRTVGSCSWTNWSGNPTTSAIAALTGLNAGTSYQVRVQAQTTGGAASSIWSHVAGTTAGTGINGYTATGTFTTTFPCAGTPTALGSNTITLTTANITWTAASPAPANGYDYYVSTVNTAPVYGTTPTGNVGAGITTASLSSLPSGTQHYFWVRTDCGAGDKGAWSASGTFTTPTLVAPPYLQSFPTAVLPTGWANGSPAYNYGAVTALTTGTTTNYAYKNVFSAGTTGSNFSTVSVGPLVGNETFSFTYKIAGFSSPYTPPASGTGDFVVAISTNYGGSYTTLETVANDGVAGWRGKTYSLAAYTGMDVRIRITSNWVTGDWYHGFDNFAFASCLPPSGLAAANITTSGADLSWTAPSPAPGFGYEYVVSTSATAPSSAANTGTDNAGTTVTVGSLSPNTTYYLHVRSECSDGSDYSLWVNSAAFTTPCDPIASLPWNDGFESLSGIGTNTFPSCWYEQNGDWQSANAGSVTAHDPRTGTYYIMNSWSATNEFMWTPTFTLIGGTSYDFSFYWSGDGVAGWTGDVFYNTSQNSTGATQLGGSFITSGTAAPANSYSQVVSTFTPPSTGTYAFAIRINATFSPNYIAFDDFAVELTPACPKPTALSAVPALNSASLDWTETGPATEWEIEYDEAPFVPTGTPNVLGISAHPYNLTGLSSQTTYTYYVRGNCGVDGPSLWAGPFTFTTLPCIPTYTTGKTVGDLLSRVAITGTTLDNNSGTAEVNPSYTFFTGQPQYTATLAAGTSYDIEVSIGTWGNQGVAVWIDFDNDGAFETPSERIGFTTGTFGVGTGGLPIDPANTTSFPISLPCDPIPGTYTMRVRDVYATGGQLIDPCANYGFGETEDYLITVAPPPPCPSVGLANVQAVTYNSVTLDWNIGCTETAWDVHVVTTGGGLTGAPNNSGITSHPTTISGLTASTAYQYYVRANCGGPVSAWVGPYSFTTPATPPANDECASATAFGTILPNQTCVTVTATTVGATGTEDATCFGNSDDDVWYTFTVPSGYSTLLYQNTTITGNGDRMLQVLDACGGASLGCYDAETGSLTGLTGGSTYYLRAFTYGVGVTSSFSICLRTPPPAPANDNCAAATAFPTIPTTGNCVSITINTAGATGSADATCTGTEDDDVWYNVTVPVGYSTLLYANTNIGGTSSDRILQVLDACGGTSLGCYDAESGILTGLTGGSTYKLRVYTWGTGVNTEFSLCLRVPPPPPANDACAGAIAFPTINTNGSCSTLTVSTESATGSADPVCSGTEDDDVWYTFTVPVGNNSILYSTTNSTGSGDRMFQVYDTCGGTSLFCSDSESGSITGLTAGSTYVLRTYTWNSGVNSVFQLCLRVPPPPPANDNCATASALAINVPSAGTTVSASLSLAGCTGTADDDVWYSFVAPAYPVDIVVIGGAGFDAVVNLRSGACDGTSVECMDDTFGGDTEVITDQSLALGQTYYVRVHSWGNGSGQGTFSIIVQPSTQPVPGNDSPAANTPNLNATNYVYPNCMQIQGTTAGSDSYEDDGYNDVWYRFVAISNGVSIRLQSNVIDGMIELYDAALNRLSDDDITAYEDASILGGGTEQLNYGDLMEGDTYYVRVANWTVDGAVDGPFSLCIQKLRKPTCVTVAPYSLCTTFKSSVTGAQTTTFAFTDEDDNTTSITNSGPISLGNLALGLLYDASYDVNMTANYALFNGLGAAETVSVSNDACSITTVAHPQLTVKVNQRCANGAVLFRNSYLQATTNAVMCGATGYRVEFTPVEDCAGTNPNGLETFEKTISSSSPSIALNYAFNQIPLVGNSGIGHWSVRWAPRFGSNNGDYGPAHVISVNGTAPAGMLQESGETMNGLESTGNTIAANLYPNPNNGDMVNLNMTGITTPDVFVRIMDGMGRVVYTNRYTVDGSLNTIVTFSKPLAAGLYMVEFTTGTDVITERMMVTK